MKQTTAELLRTKMQTGKFYTRKEIFQLLCPTQSTTAEYLFTDALVNGLLQEGVSKDINRVFRINL